MSLATERARPGREHVWLVHLEMKVCSLTYGTAPCQAALGVTGPDRCYNTRNIKADCQDTDNFTPTTVTYKFCSANVALPWYRPTIVEVDAAPTRISTDRGLGERAVARIRLLDHPWHDIGIDPYVADRTYIPFEQGSYWGKFKARNPYYRGAKLYLYSGYISPDGFSLDDFEERVYLLDEIAGPGDAWRVVLTGKDPLTILNDDRAVVPAANVGTLSASISASATSFTLSPAGIGDEEYPAAFRCRIGDEGLDVTRSGDTCTITQRGLYAGAAEHDADSTVQVVKRFGPAQVHDILYEAMTEARPDIAEFINYADWDAAVGDTLTRFYQADIPEPMSPNEIGVELMESVPFVYYWDERTQKIVLQAITAPEDTALELNDSAHLLACDVKDVPKDQLNEVWVYFDQRDPTKSRTEYSNYGQRYVRAVAELQDQNLDGEKRILRVYSRWIGTNGKAAAEELADLYLNRFRRTPAEGRIKLDAREGGVWTGTVLALSTDQEQLPSGVNEGRYYQVIESVEADPGHQYEMVLRSYDYGIDEIDGSVSITVSQNNINLRTIYDAEHSVVHDAVVVTIEEGVVIGGAAGPQDGTVLNAPSQPGPSLVPGEWPEGTTIKIVNRGTIIGAGGTAGNGGVGSSLFRSGGPGGQGGDAIETTIPLEIYNLGVIRGGGGGGGGGGAGVLGGTPGEGATGGNHGGTTATDGDPGTDSTGGDGGAGTSRSGMTGGTGGTGGAPGQPGAAGADAVGGDSNGRGGAGGAAGNYVNGYSLITWTNGDEGDVGGNTTG